MFNPFRLHHSLVHQLPVMFNPVEVQTPFLRFMLGWIPMIGLNKRNHLIVTFLPTLILSHTLNVLNALNFLNSKL